MIGVKRTLEPASHAAMPRAIPSCVFSGAGADAVASWNFEHLARLRRIRGFHAVNGLRGSPLIETRSPLWR